jgi:hypothetical protein
MDFQVSIIGIVLVLAFYLPGYFFRKLYFSGFSTKQFGLGEWYDRFFISIFLGMIIQYLTIKILKDNFHFNFDTVSRPITQFYNQIMDKKLPDLDYTNLRNGIFYLFLSMVFGSVFGFIARKIVRIARLDMTFTTLRYANIWHYYFKGEMVKTKDFRIAIPKKGKWVSTRADVLADFEKDGKNILYTGIISQYDLSHKSDKLERIYLTQAMRYSVNDKGFKEIPGDVFILDCNRILNMNLSYDFIDNNKGKKQKLALIFFSVLLLLLTFSPVILIPNIFYGRIHLWRIVAGILESLIILLFIFSAITIVLSRDQNFKSKQKQPKWQAFIIAIIIAVIFTVLLKITLYPL